MDIYEEAVRALNAGSADTFLAVCAGATDANTLRAAGCTNVTISNLGVGNVECEGFAVAYADAENLPFADQSFDWVTVHAGLHHCASPHRGLLEMCRVARKGVLVVEARDSLLIRSAVRLGLVPDYELEAVALHNFERGGVRDGATPNYIYRWTEREVEKAIASAYPHRVAAIEYLYRINLPTQRLEMSRLAKRMLAHVLGIAARLVQLIAPRQCNQFAFIIRHDGALQPWIAPDHSLRRDVPLGFDTKRYWRNR